MQPGTEGLRLEAKRVVPGSPTAVFEAFSDPAVLARWWGPKGFTTRSVDFQPRAGGRYRIEMQPPEGDSFHLGGEFREVEPPTRLAFTFAWDPPDPDDVETLAALSFRDLGDSTEVTLEQGEFKTEERRALHSDGWAESFEKLEALLAAEA
jgi:uncharacterized protein YndB with AHSA1/START domain